MASLPRPSRPSVHASSSSAGPPASSLPSIPLPKSRIASATASRIPPIRTPSSSSLRISKESAPAPSSVSSVASLSSISSLSSIPSPSSPAQVRRTISYNAFPRPPAGGKTSSPSSSNSTTPRSSVRGSHLVNGATRSASIGGHGATASASTPRAPPLVEQDGAGPSPDLDDSPRGRGRPSSTNSKDKGNVVISVRVRPEKDSGNGEGGEWNVDGKQSSIAFKGREGGEYVYDNVFSTEDSNARVYDASARRLVRRVMEGYNGTVFAYGMTGTGKTYSMQGTATSPGVIPSAITDIFSYIRETPHREFLLRVSYLEIYNEKIHDLLSMPSMASGLPGQSQEEIKLREDSKGNVYATPLKEEIVQSPTQLLRVIARGDHARKTSATQYNIKSSRSHAVVQIVVESRERNAGASAAGDKKAQVIPGGVRVSTLSLIDLAGSERAAESKERRTEGAHINKSLLTLGTVISKLSGTKDKQGQPTDNEGKHLPYRDSKLTRLLQPALSGGSLISILCTIQLGSSGSSAVAGHHTIETLNTLKFAARARNNIVSHAKKSEESHGNIGDASSRALLDRYRTEILELRKQLDGKSEETVKVRDEEVEKQKEEEEAQRHEEQIIEMHLARTALADRIEHLNRLILSSKSTGVNQSRSYSSLNFVQQRMSTLSTFTDGGANHKSMRSSGSTTLGAYNMPRDSTDFLPAQSPMSPTADEYEEDFGGLNGDGNATMAAQIRALQADLADKSRYIEDLQRKLAQARRNSRSRVSVMLRDRQLPGTDEGGAEALLREKDAVIAELREQLDDKDRMLSALKSATRRRDAADSTPAVTPPLTIRRTSSQTSAGAEAMESKPGSRASRRTSLVSMDSQGTVTNGGERSRSSLLLTRRSSTGPGAQILRSSGPSSLANGRTMSADGSASSSSPSINTPNGQAFILPSSPTHTSRSPRTPRKAHGVDEVTRMLDEMIRQKVDEENQGKDKPANSNRGSRTNSLNLLAMRDVPGSKRRLSSRVEESPEEDRGLGIRPQTDASTAVANSVPRRKRQVSLNQMLANGMRDPLPRGPPVRAPSPPSPSARMMQNYNRSTAAASQATDALRNLAGHRSLPDESTDDEMGRPSDSPSAVVNGVARHVQEEDDPSPLRNASELVQVSAN